MIFRCRIKLDDALYEKAKSRAEQLKYASVDEFVTHLLEQELRKAQNPGIDEQVIERLKGLGYIE
jgi:hypothetical protein